MKPMTVPSWPMPWDHSSKITGVCESLSGGAMRERTKSRLARSAIDWLRIGVGEPTTMRRPLPTGRTAAIHSGPEGPRCVARGCQALIVGPGAVAGAGDVGPTGMTAGDRTSGEKVSISAGSWGDVWPSDVGESIHVAVCTIAG